MTEMVKQSLDGAWIWEIIDEDGETYLRSEHRFADCGMAIYDLEAATHLIRPYIKRL